ncbi:MAG TPA: hypothetical protein VN650_13215 [Gemmatimonadaceae bacterium]|nr:hypothetical protein [Gemmatimonadaceae bacterium]
MPIDDTAKSTTIVATGASATSTVAEPDAPWADAVMMVEPTDTPVTIPLLASTEAIALLALDHATRLLPFSVTPDEFFRVTLAGSV